MTYDPAADPVHGTGWNSAAHWGGWDWRGPRRGEHFRTCSFCGSIHPEDLAAETAGTGTCTVCGQQGWEACFRKQPLGASQQEIDRLLADPSIPGDEKQRLRGEYPAHSYDPGGWYASWADRKYGWPHKFYVEGLRNREPARLFVIGSVREATEGPYAPGGEKYTTPQERTPGLQWVRPSEIPEGAITSPRDQECDWLGLGTQPTHHAKFYTMHLADPAISGEVKEKIAQACGLRFRFLPDGRIGWCPATDPPHEHDDVPA